MAAVTRETQEEHPRNCQSRNTSIPRINEEYITQVSVEIEGRVTKKMSQEFNRTESRIFVALSKLDEFLLNPQIRTHSGTDPGTFRNTIWKTRERMRSTPRVILILKQASSAARLHKTSAQKLALTFWQGFKKRFAIVLTWWQEFKKTISTAPLGLLQEEKEGALHKSATVLQLEHPCNNWSRPDFAGPSAVGEQQQLRQHQQQHYQKFKTA